MTIHNTLHISLFEPYKANKFLSQIQTPGLTIKIDREPEYQPDEISNSYLQRDQL